MFDTIVQIYNIVSNTISLTANRIIFCFIIINQIALSNDLDSTKDVLSDSTKSLVDENAVLTFSIDVGTLVDGENVASTTGIINHNASTYKRTVFIDVSLYQQVKIISSNVSTINAICFYENDAEESYVSGVSSPARQDAIDVPNGAKYAIYSGSSAPMTNTQFIGMSKTLFRSRADKITFNGVDIIPNNIPIGKVIGIETRPGNLVSLDSCENNVYVKNDNGKLVKDNGYFATSFIPVTAGAEYKSNVGRNYAWYYADKTYLDGASGTGIQNGVTAPENAAFIRFTINKTADGINSPAELYFAETSVYNDSVVIPNLVINDIKPWCYGKKINWIGDSIVAGQDFDEVVCSALGLVKESDYGINGSTIALNGNGSDSRDAVCVRYTTMSDDADIVAISCGTNDFEYAWCPIGTINDPDDGTSNTTFYGALKTLCKGLIDKYPRKLIFFTTPIKRAQAFSDGNGGEYTADGVMTTPFSKNKYGKTLMDYADIIKEVCGYYSIPVLDMYRESLLNPHIASQQDMFDNINTHPTGMGQRIMARRISGWLTQLGYKISGLA